MIFFYHKDFELFQGQGTSVHKLQKWENDAKIDKKKKNQIRINQSFVHVYNKRKTYIPIFWHPGIKITEIKKKNHRPLSGYRRNCQYATVCHKCTNIYIQKKTALYNGRNSSI